MSSKVCELCSPREYKAMRALESLTPSGSEFVNDIERCVAFVRDREKSLLNFAKKNKALHERLVVLRELAGTEYSTTDKAERFDEMAQRLEAIRQLSKGEL
jgi:hypothetical protein